MRIKRRPWADELYAENQDLFRKFPYDLRGKWHEVFKNNQPIELEIGAGKGGFITQLAQNNPNKNYIALEINEMALAYLLRKQAEKRLTNLFLVVGNADEVGQYFAEGEVSNLYLNFSDPWPKSKHEKRRLTAPNFLRKYHQILATDATIQFKTDNQGLFIYSITTMANEPEVLIDKINFDLHHSDDNVGNIRTEYEQKFADKGQPIYLLKSHFKEEKNERI